MKVTSASRRTSMRVSCSEAIAASRFHSAKGIYVRKARVVIQQMTDRRGVFFPLHVMITPPLLGLWRAIPRVGDFPS